MDGERFMSNEAVLALHVVPAALGDQLEEFARRVRLVSLMSQRATARAALEHLEIDRTTAWATKLLRRYRELGEKGLLDLRKYNGAAKAVMTTEVQSIVLRVWHDKPAGAPLIRKQVKEECKRRKLPVPSTSTDKAYLSSEPVEF